MWLAVNLLGCLGSWAGRKTPTITTNINRNTYKATNCYCSICATSTNFISALICSNTSENTKIQG